MSRQDEKWEQNLISRPELLQQLQTAPRIGDTDSGTGGSTQRSEIGYNVIMGLCDEPDRNDQRNK